MMQEKDLYNCIISQALRRIKHFTCRSEGFLRYLLTADDSCYFAYSFVMHERMRT